MGASTSWDPEGLSRPVMGLLYLFTIYFSRQDQPSSVRGLIHYRSSRERERPLFAVKEASLPSPLSSRVLIPCIFFCVAGTYLMMAEFTPEIFCVV